MSPRKQRPKMPTLNWIGKNAVVNHHKDVPFRLLEPVPEFSCPPLPLGEGAAYKCRFFHVSSSSIGNDKISGDMDGVGQGSGQPWPRGNG